MRKTLLFFCGLFIGLLSLSGQAQKPVENSTRMVNFKANVQFPLNSYEEELIREVYKDAYDSQVLNNPERLRNLKDILRNRVSVQYLPSFQKEVKSLSEVSLFNKYNPKIKRKRFDKDNFNPLSYNFDFFSKSPQIYRVDNTDYYIVIKSQYQ